MKRPTFLEGVVIALATAALAGISHVALTAILPSSVVLRALVAGIGFGYVIYLLVRSPEPVGRTTAFAGWLIATGAVAVIDPPFALHVLTQLVLIWLIRSLYFYSSVLPGLADLVLTGASLVAATWAAIETGSVAMAVWCLFLVQASFIAIPPTMRRSAPRSSRNGGVEDPFMRAHRAAETALRKLSTVN